MYAHEISFLLLLKVASFDPVAAVFLRGNGENRIPHNSIDAVLPALDPQFKTVHALGMARLCASHWVVYLPGDDSQSRQGLTGLAARGKRLAAGAKSGDARFRCGIVKVSVVLTSAI
jgi:hypothetical protein